MLPQDAGDAILNEVLALSVREADLIKRPSEQHFTRWKLICERRKSPNCVSMFRLLFADDNWVMPILRKVLLVVMERNAKYLS